MFFKDKSKGITVLIARVWLIFCVLVLFFNDVKFRGINPVVFERF